MSPPATVKPLDHGQADPLAQRDTAVTTAVASGSGPGRQPLATPGNFCIKHVGKHVSRVKTHT
jgi:hypothetical protein